MRLPGHVAIFVAVAAVALLQGCGGDDAPAGREPPRARASTTPSPTATATATAAPSPAPRARTVRFAAADGAPVTAKYTAARRGNAPAIVLLHEIRGGPDQWAPLLPDLHAAGYATLAYRSRPAPVESERLPDALGAVRWLRRRGDVDPRRIALVGASIGASTAVLAMATTTPGAIDAAVALSPVDSADIWALQDDGRYHPHDVLVVSDDREAASAEGMLEGAVRSKALRSSPSGHGVVLLSRPDVRAALLAWLRARVRAR